MHVKNGDSTDADDENDEEFYQDKATLDGNRLHMDIWNSGPSF